MKRLGLALVLTVLMLLPGAQQVSQSAPPFPLVLSPLEAGQPVTVRQVSIAFVGDIMMHNTQIGAALQPDGSYDFGPSFAEVAGTLSGADIAIGNLETTLAGPEARYSGYPMFNAPDQLADALKEAGFDILAHANNHTLDRGVNGLIRTREVLESRGILSAGTRVDPGEDTVLYFGHDGLLLALVTGTYGTNGLRLPAGREYMVNLLDRSRLLEDVTRAATTADGVICYLHFGGEYQEEPNREQSTLAMDLLEAGAVAVIGSHPHVVQKDWYSEGKLIQYSLGNFISGQVGAKRRSGIIYRITFEKDLRKDTFRVVEAGYLPVFTRRLPEGRSPFVLSVPGEDALREYSPEDRRLAAEGLEYIRARMTYATALDL